MLLLDEEIKTLLIRLDQNIGDTQKEMIVTGVVQECADCAVRGEGTCCGIRTGYKNDNILLLINLLLGKSLTSKAHYPDRCFFLTERGCSLRARHVICVNFVCRRIRINVQHEKLVHLQETAGKELNTLFMLEEYIKKKIGLHNLYLVLK